MQDGNCSYFNTFHVDSDVKFCVVSYIYGVTSRMQKNNCS